MSVIEQEPAPAPTDTPRDDDPVVGGLRRALERMRTVGWQKGAGQGDNGESCVFVTLYYCDEDGIAALDYVRRALRRDDPVQLVNTITRWNDHPDTTFEDVERVMLAAIALREGELT